MTVGQRWCGRTPGTCIALSEGYSTFVHCHVVRQNFSDDLLAQAEGQNARIRSTWNPGPRRGLAAVLTSGSGDSIYSYG
jgi:hypothetical protein